MFYRPPILLKNSNVLKEIIDVNGEKKRKKNPIIAIVVFRAGLTKHGP